MSITAEQYEQLLVRARVAAEAIESHGWDMCIEEDLTKEVFAEGIVDAMQAWASFVDCALELLSPEERARSLHLRVDESFDLDSFRTQ